VLLGRDDAAYSMPSRQNDAAVIDFSGRGFGLWLGQCGPLSQRPAAGRAPVGFRIRGQDGVAVRTDPFHADSLLKPRAAHTVLVRVSAMARAQRSIQSQSRMSEGGSLRIGLAGNFMMRLMGNGRFKC
jgi:hypothetical protein